MVWRKILDFYRISSSAEQAGEDKKRFNRVRWATFLSATMGYGIYYVCRLSMNVVRKPIVDAGVFTESQLGSLAPAFSLCMRWVS